MISGRTVVSGRTGIGCDFMHCVIACGKGVLEGKVAHNSSHLGHELCR